MRTFKIVIVGDGSVGKSSVRNVYVHKRFSANYKATIGADFTTKLVSFTPRARPLSAQAEMATASSDCQETAPPPPPPLPHVSSNDEDDGTARTPSGTSVLATAVDEANQSTESELHQQQQQQQLPQQPQQPVDVLLQLVDTAGQERFKSLGPAFYRGADACVLVFDLANALSFDSLKGWVESFIKHRGLDQSKRQSHTRGNSYTCQCDTADALCDIHEDCDNADSISDDNSGDPFSYFPFVVLGNKADLDFVAVPASKIAAFISSVSSDAFAPDIPRYYQVSAKMNSNIETAFQAVAELCHIAAERDAEALRKQQQRLEERQRQRQRHLEQQQQQQQQKQQQKRTSSPSRIIRVDDGPARGPSSLECCWST